MRNGSRRDLGDALRAAGVVADVEERDGLAVLTAHDVRSILSRRRDIVSLARAHGFTHVCVELSEEG